MPKVNDADVLVAAVEMHELGRLIATATTLEDKIVEGDRS
jgi:hypothetical protein